MSLAPTIVYKVSQKLALVSKSRASDGFAARNRRFTVALDAYEILSRHKWVMRRWRVGINMIIRFIRLFGGGGSAAVAAAGHEFSTLASVLLYIWKKRRTKKRRHTNQRQREHAESSPPSPPLLSPSSAWSISRTLISAAVAWESDIVITTPCDTSADRRSAIADTERRYARERNP